MIDGATSDESWDDHDSTIQGEVNQYRTRLLWAADWLLFKAQVWTESWAASPSWKTRPMQIGNPGDPAYATIKHQREHSDLIMSEALKKDIKANRPINDPIFNVQVGMAYAYTKVAIFGSVVTDPMVREYTVQPDDVRSLDLLEWTTYGHIALVDDVDGVTAGKLRLDISQCSGFEGGLNGPMSNSGVSLSQAFERDGTPKPGVFIIDGSLPVKGELEVRRMPGLQYASPRYPYAPPEPLSAAVGVYRRA